MDIRSTSALWWCLSVIQVDMSLYVVTTQSLGLQLSDEENKKEMLQGFWLDDVRNALPYLWTKIKHLCNKNVQHFGKKL